MRCMLLTSMRVSRSGFEAGTGWALKPEGACRGDICIPLADQPGDPVDVGALASQLGMPMVSSDDGSLHALGPWSGTGRVLTSAEAPELELPQLDGSLFRLSSLRGRKVLLVAWAPY